MPKPGTCQLRGVVPTGPLTVCKDQPCFVECYTITYREKYGVEPKESDIPSNNGQEEKE